MKTLKHQDKNWLYEHYVNKKMSADKIGKLSACCGPIVLKWLKRYNIKIRDCNDPYFKPPLNKKWKKYKTYEWLYESYVKKRMSTIDMANKIMEETNTSINSGSVTKWMERFGIKRNNRINRVYTKERHHNWTGGRYFSKKSNTWILNIDSKAIPEYRYIAEQSLGRKLKRTETIHHINGDRTDNRIENLYLFSSESDHQQYHQSVYKIVLSNVLNNYIDLSQYNFLIKKSNLVKE